MGNEVWIDSKVRRFTEICANKLWMVAWFAFAKALCLASLGLKGDLHLVLLGSSLMFIELEDFSMSQKVLLMGLLRLRIRFHFWIGGFWKLVALVKAIVK